MKKQYIDKATIKAELEKRKIPFKKDIDDGVYPTYLCALMDMEDFIDDLEVKEDVVSSDPFANSLEIAAQEYQLNHCPMVSMDELSTTFIAGAKWQEEQIMKDAIEREVKEDAGGYPYIDATELYDYDNDKPLAKAGDKVKVLIVKDK